MDEASFKMLEHPHSHLPMVLTLEENQTRNRKLEFAKHMRRNATDSERTLWGAIRQKDGVPQLGFRFQRQRLLYGYIVDFYCFAKELVVEVDGSSHDEKKGSEMR